MFRHSSDATVSWPAVLALREDALLIVSEHTAFGRTPACNCFSDKIKAFSCKETALGLTRFLKSPPHEVLPGNSTRTLVFTNDFCLVFCHAPNHEFLLLLKLKYIRAYTYSGCL